MLIYELDFKQPFTTQLRALTTDQIGDLQTADVAALTTVQVAT